MDEVTFRRSKGRYLLGVVGLGGVTVFFVWAAFAAHRAGENRATGFGIRAAFFALLTLGCWLKLRTARHVLRIKADGILDTSALPTRLPWSQVAELSLEGSERSGYRLVATTSGAAKTGKVVMDLDGLETAPSAVFGAAHARWLQARKEEPSPSVRRVLEEVRLLAKATKGCRVIDQDLRRQMMAIQREMGVDAAAELALVLRRPAPAQELERLDELCRARFKTPLPSDLRAFFAQHNGLWVGEFAEGDQELDLLKTEHYEAGIQPVSRVLEEWETEHWSETGHDGVTEKHYLPVLPFLDIPDQGWHALDFEQRQPDGAIPVVTYYFDHASDVHLKVIAPSFADWFAGWVRGGFNRFWFQPVP